MIKSVHAMSADNTNADPVQLTVTFNGRVQGVGFRYTACDLARTRKVTGFVRNEYDGSVLLVAEGAKSELEAFLQDIYRSHLGRHIQNAHQRWSQAAGQFDHFTVRFG